MLLSVASACFGLLTIVLSWVLHTCFGVAVALLRVGLGVGWSVGKAGIDTVIYVGKIVLTSVLPAICSVMPSVIMLVVNAGSAATMAIGSAVWGVARSLPWAGATALRALSVPAYHAVVGVKNMATGLLLAVKEIDPEIYYAVYTTGKEVGAFIIDVAVQGMFSVNALIDAAIVALRDTRTPYTPAPWEPILRLVFVAAVYLLTIAASDRLGQTVFIARPVFVIPLVIGTQIIAWQYDALKDNNSFVDLAGGLFVLWLVAAAAMYLYELWTERWVARQLRDLQQQRQHAERAAIRAARRQQELALEQQRAAARAQFRRNTETERARSAQAAAAAAAAEVEHAAAREAAHRADVGSADDECPICLATFSEEDCKGEFGDRWAEDGARAPLSCGHTLHCHCATEWLKRSKTCPYCRAPVTRTGQLMRRLLTVR